MPEFKYCPECGHLLPGGTVKCTHCGATVGRSEAAARRLRLIFIIVGIDFVLTAAVVVVVLLAMH